MAYTFGGAVTDGIDFTAMPTAPFNANRVGLTSCWVRPTTLTTNRCLWGVGANCAFLIGATTSDVTLVVDTATIDLNTNFPVGLAVNVWSFVAVLWNQGASTVHAERCWVGSETTGPVEVAGTVTSVPTGAWVGSGTTFTYGNTTGGSLAFQGDIGGIALFGDSQNSNLNSICGIAAAGAITQAQADAVRTAFIDPLWRGDILRLAGMGRMVRGSTQLGFALSSSLDNNIAANAWGLRAGSAPSRGTVTGATPSSRRTPHSFDDNASNVWNARRSGILVRN